MCIVIGRSTVYNRIRRYKDYETYRAFQQQFMGRKQVVNYGKHRGNADKMGRIKHI